MISLYTVPTHHQIRAKPQEKGNASLATSADSSDKNIMTNLHSIQYVPDAVIKLINSSQNPCEWAF